MDRINTVLTNLDGLVNLASVGGDLYIANNNALTSLDGLANDQCWWLFGHLSQHRSHEP